VCAPDGQEIAFDVSIQGDAQGNILLDGTATPKTDFLTARTGFVVLHPLTGVVGNKVEVEHVDGKVEKSIFPKMVNPIQPFLHIRSLTHECLPGVKVSVRMEGDTWEMEDHRNWSDASFKTYVRPLALPWPYVLKAGESVKQSIRVSLSGSVPKGAAGGGAGGVSVKLGAAGKATMPPVGIAVPPEEIDHAVARLDLLKAMAPNQLVGHHDPRAGHGLKELYGLRVLSEQTGAKAVLEIVVASPRETGRTGGPEARRHRRVPGRRSEVGAPRWRASARAAARNPLRGSARGLSGDHARRRHVLVLHGIEPQAGARGQARLRDEHHVPRGARRR
jgi:hypothetical protein